MTSSILQFVIIKAVQGTCLRSNWCEVLLLHKSQYLNKDTKERKKVSEVKRKLLNYSICFYDGKYLKIKKTHAINSRPLKQETQVRIYSSGIENNTYLNCSSAAQEIKNGKSIKSFCLSMQDWFGNHRMKRNQIYAFKLSCYLP